MLPLVAIVGRPNVGKSTLVNRVAAQTTAIVHEEPGVTRDRNYIQTDWGGKNFTLIDTGGLNLESPALAQKKESLDKMVAKQALLAVEEADAVIFVVDGSLGVLPGDLEIAQVLRSSKKPVLLVVNKIDDVTHGLKKFDFYRLGLGEPLEISALHGLEIGELLDKLISLFPTEEVEAKQAPVEASIAIVGRPNVGKSTLVNQILGEERAIVDEQAGTTRDTIDTFFHYKNKRFCLIDTAGLKRGSRVSKDVDYYGFVRTMRALDRADVALVVLDVREELAKQDLRIVQFAVERGAATIILPNKIDLLEENRIPRIILEIGDKMDFLRYIPVHPISAVTGKGVLEIFSLVEKVVAEYRRRISTARLNGFVQNLKEKGHLPSKKGKLLNVFYATQIRTSPPTFVFFVNRPEIIEPSYIRYLKQNLRKYFGFTGTPLRIYVRKRSSKKTGGQS